MKFGGKISDLSIAQTFAYKLSAKELIAPFMIVAAFICLVYCSVLNKRKHIPFRRYFTRNEEVVQF